ncbi:MAG: hypothetical protein VB062_04730 [Christensenella sp.]|nr:hypothetical protein [Christensenella sp.]
MTYKNSDIILCAPGIGRTFFEAEKTHSTFTLDRDFPEGADPIRFVRDLVEIRVSKQYRYILVPNVQPIHDELYKRGIEFLTVMPREEELNEWMKRWLKAGASAEVISSRVSTIRTVYRYSGEVPIILLSSDEWLGNILEQNPATDADENNK